MPPLILCLLTLNPALQEAAEAKRPNFVFILADDMGYSDLGCWGSEIETPHLDSLAAAGVRFTQTYNTSKCFPSRACLLTGVWAQQVNMDRGPGEIRGAPTFGAVLGATGYRCFWSGKHHGTQNPVTTLGFERYFGLRDGACNYFNPGRPRSETEKPAQKRNNRAWCIDDQTTQGWTPDDPDFYTTDAFTDWALKFLDTTRGDDRPFALYLAYNAPHDPLHARPEDIARFAGRYDVGWPAIRDARVARQNEMKLFGEPVSTSPADYRDWDEMKPEQRREEARRMQVYAAMVHCMDRNIGRVREKLRELGELDDTLILFASDNGGSAEVVRKGTGEIGSITRWASLQKRWANVCNTPLRRYKNHSYEGGICTPMIAHWPSGIAEPGRIDHTPLHFVDVLPTMMELGRATQGRAPAGPGLAPLSGCSFAPLLRGEALERKQPLFWKWAGGSAIRVGDWKLVRQGKTWELYDLSRDRTEMHDLAAQEPERREELIARWQKWWEEVGGKGS